MLDDTFFAGIEKIIQDGVENFRQNFDEIRENAIKEIERETPESKQEQYNKIILGVFNGTIEIK